MARKKVSTINAENIITALDATEKEFAKATAEWPISRLVETWNSFAGTIDYNIIKSKADALVSSGLKAAGYQFVNIDEGGGRELATVPAISRLSPLIGPAGCRPLRTTSTGSVSRRGFTPTLARTDVATTTQPGAQLRRDQGRVFA